MIITFSKPVCPACKSQTVRQGCQVQAEDGEFYTKHYWLENPDKKVAEFQKSIAISDPTNYVCDVCEHEFTLGQILKYIRPVEEHDRKMTAGVPFTVRETIGFGVVNPRGILKGKK